MYEHITDIKKIMSDLKSNPSILRTLPKEFQHTTTHLLAMDWQKKQSPNNKADLSIIPSEHLTSETLIGLLNWNLVALSDIPRELWNFDIILAAVRSDSNNIETAIPELHTLTEEQRKEIYDEIPSDDASTLSCTESVSSSTDITDIVEPPQLNLQRELSDIKVLLVFLICYIMLGNLVGLFI